MTGKKGMKHYLVGLNREAVRLYQEITELPGRTFFHPFFHGVDLLLDHFQKFYFLMQASLCFRGQLPDPLVQLVGHFGP